MLNNLAVELSEQFKGTTLVSCPGKVLVVGSYLVLEKEYEGLVVSTDARFYSWVVPSSNPTFAKAKLTSEPFTSPHKFNISIQAAQFTNPPWYYLYEYENGFNLKECLQLNSNPSNKFVFCALDAAYRYLHQVLENDLPSLKRLSESLNIFLFADNDFYSQRQQLAQRGLELSFEELSRLPKFVRIGGRLEEAHKTGLGSSACLVTSLVGAVIGHFLPQPSSLGTLEEVFRLSQYAHCRAQGKVGSGFDVTAAVYGSHIYRRFTPSLLSELFVQDSNNFDNEKFLRRMNLDVWDHVMTPIRLPPLFHMVLGEVDAGSNTLVLVSQVLKWRAAERVQAQKLWHMLSDANSRVLESFSSLSKLHSSDAASYSNALDLWVSTKLNKLPQPPESQNAVYKAIANLVASFQSSRRCLRQLSAAANVPIEPPEQTTLLDALQAIPEVVIAGVPGAGGYDAVFAIYVDSGSPNKIPTPLAEIQACFKRTSNSSFNVGPLLTQEDSGTGLCHEDLDAPAAEAGFALLNYTQT